MESDLIASKDLTRAKLRTAIVFVSGLLVGVLVSLLILHHRATQFLDGRNGMRVGRYLHQLPDTLSLDDRQRSAWLLVMRNQLRPRLHELRAQHQQAVVESVQNSLNQLAPMLNEQQRQQLSNFAIPEPPRRPFHN